MATVAVLLGTFSVGLEKLLAYLPPDSPWAWLLVLASMSIPWGAMCSCSGCLGGPILFFMSFARKTMRRYRYWGLLFWISAWGIYPLSMSVPDLKTPGLARIVRNAQPVVSAIERYNDEKGEYPASLEVLVPSFLEAIPHTGALGHPKYEYRRAEFRDSFKHYELCVYTTWGYVFDRFVYWPEGNYPDRMPVGGGFTTLHDGWAYVHD